MTRLIFFLVIGLASMFQSSLVQAQEKGPAEIEPDVVYGHKDGLALTLDVYRPAEPNGAAVVFMVSGGWFSRWAPPEQLIPVFQPYLDKGYTMIAVRHGSSPRYSIPEALSDVRRSVRFVRKHASRFGIDAKRIGVMGMSAGGHLSLMLGTTGDDGNAESQDDVLQQSSRVAVVIALVPPTDLRVAVWESPESLPAYRNFPALDLPLKKAADVSPLTKVTSDDAPALIIMGGKDDLVPAKHGEWISEAFQEHNVPHKLIILPNAGHGLAGKAHQGRVVNESIAWLEKHVGEKE